MIVRSVDLVYIHECLMTERVVMTGNTAIPSHTHMPGGYLGLRHFQLCDIKPHHLGRSAIMEQMRLWPRWRGHEVLARR